MLKKSRFWQTTQKRADEKGKVSWGYLGKSGHRVGGGGGGKKRGELFQTSSTTGKRRRKSPKLWVKEKISIRETRKPGKG